MIYEDKRKHEFWKSVKCDPEYSDLIAKIKNDYREYSENGIKPLTKESFNSYFETGDRAPFENDYFSRRVLLTRAFILSLLYPEKEEYLKTVKDVISAICEEYSWVIPAHYYAHKVDLFSSETALIITECVYFLEDRIDDEIKKKAYDEVKKRVIDPYEENEFAWEKYTSNWSSVCPSCIAITMMYSYPEVLKRNLDRIINTQKLFLSGFSDEGICMEGPTYWAYGYGNFVWFADALIRYSNGKYNLFDIPKAKTVAIYPNYSVLCGGAFVSFSDSSRKAVFSKPLINCITYHYPDIRYNINDCNLIYSKSPSNTQNFILRNFFFGGPIKNFELDRRDYFLPSSGQMIFNRSDFSFAIKSGHNGELHNHNDVGSFIFADKEGQAICDLGAGYYNSEYFSDKRYDILCTSSLGHSLPIIDGLGQKAGSDYSGTISRDGNTVLLDIKNAYGINELKKLTRKVVADENGVVITDCFDGNISLIVERFVTVREPQVQKEIVRLGKTAITFDSNCCTLSIAKDLHRQPGDIYETVYLLDFKANTNVKTLVFRIEV